jgi:hypothetical protein
VVASATTDRQGDGLPKQSGSSEKGRPTRSQAARRAVALALVGALAAVLLAPASASAQAPVASFAFFPPAPFTAQRVVFTSTSTGTITDLAWDLDGDGECDDANGPVATASFATAGDHQVSLCVNGGDALQRQAIPVRNRPPLAAFTATPTLALRGQPVTLASISSDPDGPIAAQAWDLDGDRAFDDAATPSATVTFPTAGPHPVGLEVTDRDGATSSAFQSILVVEPPPPLLSPFPVIRIVSRTTVRGVRVLLLVVHAPRGAKVRVHCKGRSCPWRRRSVRPRHGHVRIRALERPLRAGTVIEVFVSRPGRIGKYTRIRIRRGRAPARKDACIRPGARRPGRCPAEAAGIARLGF